MRAWRAANPERWREYERKRYHKRKAELSAIKLESGCARCGYSEHPAALDFHHRDEEGKSFTLAESVRFSRERLTTEIAKCDVLCANCHRIEHASCSSSYYGTDEHRD